MKMENNKQQTRILGLDLFRFVAALGILSYHYFFIGVLQNFYSEIVFHPIAFWGEFGVDIFFIISGFVILLSTQRKPNAYQFLKGRIIRIYPTFILCSLFVMLIGFFMPNISKNDLIFRWINSLTFLSDIWGVNPLSNIYWTLMVEVKFYICVAIIMKLNIWEKHKYHILTIWLGVSLLNMFTLQHPLIETLFNTKYSGHFTLGILIYQLYYCNSKNKWMLPIGTLSIWLIYRNMLSYTVWIRTLYSSLPYSDIDIFIGLLVIISFFIFSINTHACGKLPPKFIHTLGAWSFTLYLIHADFGFFLRTQYYTRIIQLIGPILNEHIIMAIETIASLLVSYIFYKIVSEATAFVKRRLNKSSYGK